MTRFFLVPENNERISRTLLGRMRRIPTLLSTKDSRYSDNTRPHHRQQEVPNRSFSSQAHGHNLLGPEGSIVEWNSCFEMKRSILQPTVRAVKNRRRGMLTRGVGLTPNAFFRDFWNIFVPSSYSSDFATSDYNRFTKLNELLGGKYFSDDEDCERDGWKVVQGGGALILRRRRAKDDATPTEVHRFKRRLCRKKITYTCGIISVNCMKIYALFHCLKMS